MKKVKNVIAGLLVMVAVTFALSGCGGVSVSSVKDAYLKDYSSTVTVGDALDSYLSNPKWHSFEATTGEDVVECDGQCEYMDKTVDIQLQFIIEDDMFRAHVLTIDGEEQTDMVMSAFLEAVYDDAN